MRNTPVRSQAVRLGLFLAGSLLAALAQAGPILAAVPPPPPEPPPPPTKPEISVKGFNVRPGETHRGDVVRFAPSVNIEGTLDGDMYVFAPTVRISGVVTGDVFVSGSQVDVTGEIKKSLRAFGANVVVDGTVNGSVLVSGGTLTLGSKAHVLENVTAYTGQFTHHGVVDGSLTFTGGTAVIGGKVQEDATLTADTIEIEPGAHFEGDVSYSTRKQMDEELKAVTGGDVAFDEEPIKTKEHRRDDDGGFQPSSFGFGKWLVFLVASSLFGCALLALFRDHEPRIVQAIQGDALRTLGIGFVSVLVTIAVCLSFILILTIPLIVLYLIAYTILYYLARVPVAVWLGGWILSRLGRPGHPYLALFVGLTILHAVFVVPILGPTVHWVLMPLLGLGAMISVFIAQRQMRKAALAMATASVPPPSAPPPSAVAAS
jgi:cytoskeletal protein CcmA (bactofilin family)